MNTSLRYTYRDASNYKQYEEVVFEGRISEASVRKYLWEDEYFLPAPLGLPTLQKKFLEQGFGLDASDDHPWHEVDSITSTNKTPTVGQSAIAFLFGIRNCQEYGWKKLLLKEHAELQICIRSGLEKS